MRNQEKKIMSRSCHFMVLIVLVLIMPVMGVESYREGQETLIAHLVETGEINQETAELLLTKCRNELFLAEKTIQDSELCYMKKSLSDSAELVSARSSRTNMHDTMDVRCPQVKQILLNCLVEKNVNLPISTVEKDLDALYMRYLRSLLLPHYPSGRRELAQLFGEPAASSMLMFAVVAASVAFAVAMLLLCCCCRTGSGHCKNDERPLLTLSLSDNSGASPQRSFSLGELLNEENLETPLGTTAQVAANSAADSVQVSPGTVRAHGIPPLKPPPGRPNPLLGKTAPCPPSPPVRPAPPPTNSSSGCLHSRPPGPPPLPPISSSTKAGPRPPPPPGAGAPPPRPPPLGVKPTRQRGPHNPSTSSTADGEANGAKAKLKPFFWDKVSANPDHSMVWNEIKSGSFQFNEEMMESLFGYTPAGKNNNGAKKESSSKDPSPQYVQIIDPKKSQNLSIMLKALNVTTEEVCDALEEGNELPSELIQTLLKMAPTAEEELKLRLYSGDLSQLGSAERFLKLLVDIPFAYKRLESLLFMCTLQEEMAMLKESFVVLQAACIELRKSRLFLKLLEAVLKTGNRMNDGTFRGGAQAFKLDTLLKLSDVKGVDGKTTLLHFVVLEIIRSEGIRAARAAQEMRSMSSFKSEDLLENSVQDSDENLKSIGLQVVSGLGHELKNVTKAAALDADGLTGTVAKLGHALNKAKDFLNSDMKRVAEDNGFHETLRSFVQNAEGDVKWLLEEDKRIMALMKSTADYFHGNSAKDEGLRLFVVVRDFLIILDKVCKEVKNVTIKPAKKASKEQTSEATPPDARKSTSADPRRRLFPAIADRRQDSSSSSDDDSQSEVQGKTKKVGSTAAAIPPPLD